MGKLSIGKVRTSSGIKGYFKVLSHSGETAHFKKLKGVTLDFKSRNCVKNLTIEDVRISGKLPLLKVVGVDSPEEAKKLSGYEIFVDRENAAPLKKKEFYHADLCNCSLIYNNTKIGNIKAVCDNGVSDMLEVDYNGKMILIPFLDRFVGEVDIDKQTVELKEDWFLE